MISIITVVKNGMPYIMDTINSYESQNFINKELIVVYSKSNDRTFEYLNLKKNIIDKLIIDDAGKNKFDAINLGIKHASGKIIGILHGDDIFYSHNILSIVNKYFQKRSIDVLYGNCLFVDRSNISKTLRFWKSEPFKQSRLLKGWMPPHTTLFVKKKIVGSYDSNFKYSSDFDYIINIFKKNYKFFYLDKIITIMRTGGDSKKFFIKKVYEDYKIFKKNKLKIFFLLYKYLSKINQLIIKRPNIKNISSTKKLKNFLFINNIAQLNKKIRAKNFLICAFNFNCFTFLINKIISNKDIILWPDGYWANFFFSYTNKEYTPGRFLFSLKNIYKLMPPSKYLYFIGTMEPDVKKELILFQNKFTSNINKYKFLNIKNNLTHHQIIDYLRNYNFIKNSIAIITITSPKQEFIGEYLLQEKKISSVCIGAAMNMNLGKEKTPPQFIQYLRLEFLYRLRNNFSYRLKRLIISIINAYNYSH